MSSSLMLDTNDRFSFIGANYRGELGGGGAYLASLNVRCLRSTQLPKVNASMSSVPTAKHLPDLTSSAH